MRRNGHILTLLVGMEIVAELFWQAVGQYALQALKASMLLPYLLEICVEIFMNEMM